MDLPNKKYNRKDFNSRLRYLVMCAYCWLFGHEPYEGYYHNFTSCTRCGVWDIGYHDLVSPSRYQILRRWTVYFVYFKWKYILQKTKKLDDSVNEEEIPF